MMKKKLKGQKFVLLVINILFMLGLVYFIVVDRLVIYQRLLPYSTYKQFMQENTAELENKIVILAGSNALHAVNAPQLENYFNRPVINLSSNAGFPITHYLFGMHDYLQDGDVLILPLEWTNYSHGRVTSSFYNSLVTDWIGTTSYYYRKLPLIDKIKYVFSDLSIDNIYKAAFRSRHYPIQYLNQQFNEIIRIHDIAYGTDSLELRGSSSRNNFEIEPQTATYKSCDSYILAQQLNYGFVITDYFYNLLAELIKYKNEGVDIIFAPPSVVSLPSDKCYSSNAVDNLDIFVNKIISILSEFSYVGHYTDFVSNPNCFLDTYLHIKSSCSRDYTTKLINRIKDQIKMGNTNLDNYNFIDYIREKFASDIRIFLSSVNESNEIFGIKKSTIHSQAIPLEGWSPLDQWGVWSEGRQSKILIAIPFVASGYSIAFEGQYLGGEEATSIYLNGTHIADKSLNNATLSIPDGIIRKGANYITLVHTNIQKPSDLNPNSTDDRDLKYRLHSLKIDFQGPGIFPNTTVAGKNLSKYINFISGWYEQETWGIWSEAFESSFVIEFDPARKPIALHFNGHYFGAKESTSVEINGISVGEYLLENQVVIIPDELGNNKLLVVLKHSSPISPAEISNQSSDTRKIKYALESIKLLYND